MMAIGQYVIMNATNVLMIYIFSNIYVYVYFVDLFSRTASIMRREDITSFVNL